MMMMNTVTVTLIILLIVLIGKLLLFITSCKLFLVVQLFHFYFENKKIETE